MFDSGKFGAKYVRPAINPFSVDSDACITLGRYYYDDAICRCGRGLGRGDNYLWQVAPEMASDLHSQWVSDRHYK
jgi:hypothetical protein